MPPFPCSFGLPLVVLPPSGAELLAGQLSVWKDKLEKLSNIEARLCCWNDELMTLVRTKETLATGHFMSVINILMQLRKVCNHPDLFDPRPTVSPFRMESIVFTTASLVLHALHQDPMKVGESLCCCFSIVKQQTCSRTQYNCSNCSRSWSLHGQRGR